MKLNDFVLREEKFQYQIVWEIGKHIETLHQDGIVYLLYAINDFFVELKYCRITNVILGKEHFKDGMALDKYIYR